MCGYDELNVWMWIIKCMDYDKKNWNIAKLFGQIKKENIAKPIKQISYFQRVKEFEKNYVDH